MTHADIVSLLERHRDAFKRRDADELAACFSERGSLVSPAHGVVEGRKPIADVYRYWFTAFPDLQVTWDQPIVDGDRAAIFWAFAGTSHGPFFGAVGAGSRIELKGAAEYVFGDDGITSLQYIYDFSAATYPVGTVFDSATGVVHYSVGTAKIAPIVVGDLVAK